MLKARFCNEVVIVWDFLCLSILNCLLIFLVQLIEWEGWCKICCPGTSCLFLGMCRKEPAWTGNDRGKPGELKVCTGKGGSVASQRKHKTAEKKHESGGHSYDSGVFWVLLSSSERCCGLTLPAASTTWQEAPLSLLRPSVFVLGMPLKVLSKCWLFHCSSHAYIPLPSFVMGVM